MAEKFGAEGFAVALVARSAERLDAGVKALAAKGVKAVAVSADLSDPAAAAAIVTRANAALGPIDVVHWNAYSGSAGDLLAASAAELRTALDMATTCLVAMVKAVHADLRKADRAALLVTNGGFGKIDPQVDAVGVQYNAMGLSLANAAKDKLVGLLAAKLKPDNIYVGQVTVNGTIKGSAFDRGSANLEARVVAERFWAMYRERKDTRATAP